jgi:hypothetical protein
VRAAFDRRLTHQAHRTPRGGRRMGGQAGALTAAAEHLMRPPPNPHTRPCLHTNHSLTPRPPAPPRKAGRKLGLKEEALRSNVAALEALVPGLAPNLDKMKASDWVGGFSSRAGGFSGVLGCRDRGAWGPVADGHREAAGGPRARGLLTLSAPAAPLSLLGRGCSRTPTAWRHRSSPCAPRSPLTPPRPPISPAPPPPGEGAV